MQHISEIVPRQPGSITHASASTSTVRPLKRLPRSWVRLLWAKLTAIYGTDWTRRFGEAQDIELAQEAWAEGLADMEGEQIATALESCRKSHKWAPSSPAEFRERAGIGVSAPYHRRFHRALPPPPAKPETVRREMAVMRRVLGWRKPALRRGRWAVVHGMVPRV